MKTDSKKKTAVDLALNKLTIQARNNIPKELFSTIVNVSHYLSTTGLTLEEACLLSDYEYERFKKHMKDYPIINKIVALKELKWKQLMLDTLSKSARAGDDKTAQWLLMHRYPDEFNISKRKGSEGMDADFLGQAVRFIQENGDNKPLVSQTAAKVSGTIAVERKNNKNIIHEILK